MRYLERFAKGHEMRYFFGFLSPRIFRDLAACVSGGTRVQGSFLFAIAYGLVLKVPPRFVVSEDDYCTSAPYDVSLLLTKDIKLKELEQDPTLDYVRHGMRC